MKTIISTMLALSALLCGSGCSPLAPQPDRSKFFILTPISDDAATVATQVPAASSSQLTLGVGPIYFPAYLRRPEIVTLASPNQIDLSAEKRWGEPLDKNFERVITENLTQLLGTQRVEKYPWSRNVHVDFQIVIDVQRFDTSSDGLSHLTARWIIKDGATAKDLFASETSSSLPVGPGDTGASAALSQDLAILSRAIASRLEAFNHARSSA